MNRESPRYALGSVAVCLLLLGASLCQAQPTAAVAPAPKEAGAAKTRTLHLPEKPYNYAAVELPAHFKTREVRELDNTPRDNPITDAGATLGRVLFYDTRLSANNTVACASCHHQKNAFSDPSRGSKGFEGKETDRNAMTLVDIRYYPRDRFFWDERARSLEEQVLMPIQSKVEMGMTLPQLLDVLGKDADYPALYRAAFGDSRITKDRTAKALAQFVRSLVSYQSKFDVGMAKADDVGDDFSNFTREENRGKSIFLRNCASCHLPRNQGAAFTSPRPQNNGLDADVKVADLGVADITFDRNQAGRFKSPSLRNIEFTGPYMHDGRLAKLEDVIEHYSSGIKRHPNLEGRLAGPALRGPGGGPPGAFAGPAAGGFRFDTREKAALLAFLKTLSDQKFITDPKFSDPFSVEN